jgi:hypothetical protein
MTNGSSKRRQRRRLARVGNGITVAGNTASDTVAAMSCNRLEECNGKFSILDSFFFARRFEIFKTFVMHQCG